jgi:hypothetical protein
MSLEWYEDAMSSQGCNKAYRAELPWERSGFGDSYYHIYAWKGAWAFNRPRHPLLGECSGRIETLDEAKAICEADFEQQRRLRAWRDYMLSTDPPQLSSQ